MDCNGKDDYANVRVSGVKMDCNCKEHAQVQKGVHEKIIKVVQQSRRRCGDWSDTFYTRVFTQQYLNLL